MYHVTTLKAPDHGSLVNREHQRTAGEGGTALAAQSMWDNTFFVFSSDNGPEQGNGGSVWCMDSVTKP